MSAERHNVEGNRSNIRCPFDEEGYPAAYVLGALDGDEQTRFIGHLPTCERCTAAVSEFGATTRQLALAGAPEMPSPELRTRLLAAVAADAAQERQAHHAAQRSTPFLLRRRAPQIYALAAVLLLAIGLGQLAWNLTLQRSLQQTRVERDQARGELAITRWQLAATQANQQITGEVVYLRDLQQAVLVVNGLPALQANQVYEVWLIKEGSAPEPQTVFLTSTTGIQANLDHYQKIAITIEPGPRGSLAPTSPPVAIGSPVQ